MYNVKMILAFLAGGRGSCYTNLTLMLKLLYLWLSLESVNQNQIMLRIECLIYSYAVSNAN